MLMGKLQVFLLFAIVMWEIISVDPYLVLQL